ncbi:MAG: hypothetical protein WDW36_008825 [Sanguina aurantia]
MGRCCQQALLDPYLEAGGQGPHTHPQRPPRYRNAWAPAVVAHKEAVAAEMRRRRANGSLAGAALLPVPLPLSRFCWPASAGKGQKAYTRCGRCASCLRPSAKKACLSPVARPGGAAAAAAAAPPGAGAAGEGGDAQPLQLSKVATLQVYTLSPCVDALSRGARHRPATAHLKQDAGVRSLARSPRPERARHTPPTSEAEPGPGPAQPTALLPHPALMRARMAAGGWPLTRVSLPMLLLLLTLTPCCFKDLAGQGTARRTHTPHPKMTPLACGAGPPAVPRHATRFPPAHLCAIGAVSHIVACGPRQRSLLFPPLSRRAPSPPLSPHPPLPTPPSPRRPPTPPDAPLPQNYLLKAERDLWGLLGNGWAAAGMAGHEYRRRWVSSVKGAATPRELARPLLDLEEAICRCHLSLEALQDGHARWNRGR